jgi:hypothetical protein
MTRIARILNGAEKHSDGADNSVFTAMPFFEAPRYFCLDGQEFSNFSPTWLNEAS